jgi:hypothetical protein
MNVVFVPIEQVSDRMTQNNRNLNNHTVTSVPTEKVSTEEFYYEELTPDQMVALHQEKWTQHLDRGLNRWEIMTINGSESLIPYSGSPDNFSYVLSSRIRGIHVLSDSISVEKLQHLGKTQGLVFSQKVTKLIKYHGDKGISYDVIPLDCGINNYDVYNRNELIKTIIFYTYIIFIKFK